MTPSGNNQTYYPDLPFLNTTPHLKEPEFFEKLLVWGLKMKKFL